MKLCGLSKLYSFRHLYYANTIKGIAKRVCSTYIHTVASTLVAGKLDQSVQIGVQREQRAGRERVKVRERERERFTKS